MIINLFIRIPRILAPRGLDGFLAIWQAKLILDGNYFQNGASFSFLLGITPFSGYPILLLFIIGFFLIITGGNIIAAILLFDLFFTVIFVLSAYYLSFELELKESTSMYFILILTTLPNIYTFSYYTTSARYPFFALLPLLLALLIKFNKSKEIKYFIIAITLGIILNFIHRMAISLIAIIGLSLLFFIIEKISKKDLLMIFHNKDISIETIDQTAKHYGLKRKLITFTNYFKKRIWIFGIIIFYLISFVIFGLDFYDVYFSARFNIYCYLIEIIDCKYVYLFTQPIVDQWFQYGIPLFLFLISLIVMFIPKFENILNTINKNSSKLKIIYFTISFILIYQLIYSFYFSCYIIAIMSAIMIQHIENKKYRHYLWPTVGILVGVLITFYHFFTSTKILPYLIVALFIISISIIAILLLIIKNTRNWLSIKFSSINKQVNLSIAFLMGLIIFNSMFVIDRSLFTTRAVSIHEYITPEERELAEFLIENGFGTFDSFDNTLSVHIAALSGWYFIQDQNNLGVFLIENRSIDELNCSITPLSEWFSLKFIDCSYTDGRQILYRQLFVTECFSIKSIMILKEFNIRYFISSRHYNTSFAWQYSIESDFIKSLYTYVPIVKITENYYVWNTSTIYS